MGGPEDGKNMNNSRTIWQATPAIIWLVLATAAIAAQPSWKSVALPQPNVGDQQTCCVVADFDCDGVEDFAIGERTKTPSIVWYRLDTKGRWQRRVIDRSPLRPEAGGTVCDLDGDGDLDLILGQDSSGNTIWWWENPQPDFNDPWPRHLIKKGGARKHHDQTAGDFDGDGLTEFVSWNQKDRALLLYDIPDQPKSLDAWRPSVIYRWTSGMELEGFPAEPIDVDLDGKLDLVGGGRWFRHVAAAGTHEFEAEVIDDRMRFTQCAAGQIIEGGRPEIVFSPGDMKGTARWYQFNGKAWEAHELDHVDHGHTCEMADLDGDGNQDILIGEMGDPGAKDNARIIVWYGTGQGEFTKSIIHRGQGIHEGRLGDFNGDGRPDIILKPYHHNAPLLIVLLNQKG
jgi:hypothetical protein